MKPHITGPTVVLLALLLVGQAIFTGRVLAQPEITEANPAHGATLDQVPESLHLCFSEPVNVESGWAFSVKAPNGTALGLRIVFDPSGNCVNVFPGKVQDDATEGIWTFDWRVQSQATADEGSGTIQFQVGGDFGLTPAPTTPPAGATAEKGGSDTLTIVLIVVAGILAVASIGLLVYGRWRRRRSPRRTAEGGTRREGLGRRPGA